eukprot:NODE_4571_length_647_cov_63.580268_g3915_i0.p1 GENE.NODE_4571_length_647_cov_63.580268_g3915_i0~~NODE_4571_length_647_cov_63.580268_g3915_i0.p1  ORF type:complete len:166 (+),score=45.75 NODE_4571_length_647_cov_63.580268_g3915_i0:36-500(+)
MGVVISGTPDTLYNGTSLLNIPYTLAMDISDEARWKDYPARRSRRHGRAFPPRSTAQQRTILLQINDTEWPPPNYSHVSRGLVMSIDVEDRRSRESQMMTILFNPYGIEGDRVLKSSDGSYRVIVRVHWIAGLHEAISEIQVLQSTANYDPWWW